MTHMGGPRIVCITGGTGFRHVARELVAYTSRSSHVINVSDSGRSTRQLRIFFEMPAIGDIRSRLLDLADRKAPGYREITELLNHRLNESEGPLSEQWGAVLNGTHQKVRAMRQHAPCGFARIVMTHLRDFDALRQFAETRRDAKFDFNNASIGNLFLTGAYLHYGRDIETAIFLYKTLARVQGEVIPATTENIHLQAVLADGARIVGQHLISGKQAAAPIVSLSYLDREDLAGNEIKPGLNPSAVEPIKEADIFVFSMGSFYTSILSTLHLMGMAEAIRKSQARKVFIANPTEDAETRGMTTGQMAGLIISTLRRLDPNPSAVDQDYLQTVIVGNYSGPVDFRDGFNFISPDMSNLTGIEVKTSPLDESETGRGRFAAQSLAETLLYLRS